MKVSERLKGKQFNFYFFVTLENLFGGHGQLYKQNITLKNWFQGVLWQTMEMHSRTSDFLPSFISHQLILLEIPASLEESKEESQRKSGEMAREAWRNEGSKDQDGRKGGCEIDNPVCEADIVTDIRNRCMDIKGEGGPR